MGDIRDAASDAQIPAQDRAADTALRFNAYSRHERFVDDFQLVPADYHVLRRLGLTLIPIEHEDDEITQWLAAAAQETDLTPDELADREDAYHADVARSEYGEPSAYDLDPDIDDELEADEDDE